MNNITPLNTSRPSMGTDPLDGAPVAHEGVRYSPVDSSLHIVDGGFGGLGEIDGVVAPEIEAALTRNDPLGALFATAFDYQAGPIPAFTD